MNSLPKRLAYDHKKFVDRESEVKLVLDKVRRLLGGELLDRRTIIFHGQRGTGKSWLLQELAHQLQNMAKALTCRLDLQEFGDHVSGQEKAIVSGILEQICENVTKWVGDVAKNLPPESGPDQKATLLVDELKKLSAPLVLLIDHVDEADKTLLETLENHFLAPLSSSPCVLLIMAGRGRKYPWKSPELRLRAQHCDLNAFSLQDTQKQLEKQIPASLPKVKDIQKLSAGYPWTNYLLAHSAGQQWAQVLGQIVDRMLVGRQDLRPFFEALCVLRSFDESRMAEPLANYPQLDESDWNYSACRVVRERLVDAALVRWTENGYAIDEALRTVLEAYLFRHDVDLWVCLHCIAFRMFDDWATRHGARWQHEAEYHAAQLTRAGFDPNDCPHSPSPE